LFWLLTVQAVARDRILERQVRAGLDAREVERGLAVRGEQGEAPGAQDPGELREPRILERLAQVSEHRDPVETGRTRRGNGSGGSTLMWW
jgi:hypothetical protein